jgi:hypothetical protein
VVEAGLWHGGSAKKRLLPQQHWKAWALAKLVSSAVAASIFAHSQWLLLTWLPCCCCASYPRQGVSLIRLSTEVQSDFNAWIEALEQAGCTIKVMLYCCKQLQDVGFSCSLNYSRHPMPASSVLGYGVACRHLTVSLHPSLGSTLGAH